jgi:polyhydroxybutyrate depolymerase
LPLCAAPDAATLLVVRALLFTLAFVAAVAGLGVRLLWNSRPPAPRLTGRIESGKIQHGGKARSWVAYLPVKQATPLALVIALHSSMGSGLQAREAFGYGFDVLADQAGFIVAYPNGYQGHWNEARAVGPFAAKTDKIDDVGFLRALVDELVERHHVDRARVFVTGVSNGGSMVLRLALAAPEFAHAYAVVAASVPAPQNMAAAPSNRPVSILFMNGTGDPFNPWGGGDVALFGVWGNRGPVLSTQASVDYFRGLAGLEIAPVITALPDRVSTDGSTVERSVWAAPGKPRVVLYAVRGGGHDVPDPAPHGRRLLGNANRDIQAANEIWEFFMSTVAGDR